MPTCLRAGTHRQARRHYNGKQLATQLLRYQTPICVFTVCVGEVLTSLYGSTELTPKAHRRLPGD